MNNKTRTLLVYHLPVLLYAGGIIAVSSIRNLPSPQIEGLAMDKVAHFVEYALFAFLAFRSVSHLNSSMKGVTTVLLSLGFLIVFAALDEYYQQFVPGREPDALDIISDIAGALLVLAILWFRERSRRTIGRK